MLSPDHFIGANCLLVKAVDASGWDFPWDELKHGDGFLVKGSTAYSNVLRSFRNYRMVYLNKNNVLLRIEKKRIGQNTFYIQLLDHSKEKVNEELTM